MARKTLRRASPGVHPSPRVLPGRTRRGIFLSSRTFLIVLVLLADAVTALSSGWIAAQYHLVDTMSARFISQKSPSPARSPTHALVPSPPPAGTRLPLPRASATFSPVPTPLPPAVVAYDTFERAAGPLWRVASDGFVWEGDANSSDAFTLNGESGVITSGDDSWTALLGRPLTNAEVDVQGSCSRFVGGTNIGIVLRWRDENHWYKSYFDGTHLVIIKRVVGRTITMGSVPFKAIAGVLYTLRFRSSGAQLLTSVGPSNGGTASPWMVVSDSSPFGPGEEGVRVFFHGRGSVTARFASYRVYSTR